MIKDLLKRFHYLIIPAKGFDCGQSFPLPVKLKPSRAGGVLALFLGILLVLGPLLLAPLIWRQSEHASTVHLALNLLGGLFLIVAFVGGVCCILFGLALFLNGAVWTLDSEHASCMRRLLLKKETWSEPLRRYESVLLVNTAAINAGPPAFRIVLKHSVDNEKSVLLYASDSYQQFLRRGNELADILKLPLAQGGGSSR